MQGRQSVIHLFCNLHYGAPYLSAAATFARAHGVLVHVVLSGRKGPPGSPLRAITRAPRQGWKRWRTRRRVRRETGLAVHHVTDVNAPSFLARIAHEDHGVVCGFDQIFGQESIDCFASIVNFHPSLLPFYRGPVPSYWCLAHGEEWSGFTLHRVTSRIDDGEILHQEKVPTAGVTGPGELDRRISERGAIVLGRYLASLRGGIPWVPEREDARAIYRVPIDYASFPRARRGGGGEDLRLGNPRPN